jgi:hypothetical protein
MPNNSMTMEQLAEWLIAEISKMDPDQKAHVRAKLYRSFGKVKKSDKPN